MENIDSLTYLINYSKIPTISRKQIQLIFNRHKYDYFLNVKNLVKDKDFVLEEDDLVIAIKDFLSECVKIEDSEDASPEKGLFSSK